MISSDFRAEARRKLAGKWGKVALITLAYIAVFFAIGFVEGIVAGILGMSSDSAIFSIINFLIEIPLAFGLIISLFKVYNAEDVTSFSFWSFGFQNFKKSWGVALQMVLKLIVPVILLVVSLVLISFGLASTFVAALGDSSAAGGTLGISVIGFILYFVALIWMLVKSYYYQLSYIIAADQPELTAKEAVLKSQELMSGKRGKLFFLQLSFIGWIILASFTLGIGMLWLLPYIQFATFAFYDFVAGKKDNVVVEESTEPVNTAE